MVLLNSGDISTSSELVGINDTLYLEGCNETDSVLFRRTTVFSMSRDALQRITQ